MIKTIAKDKGEHVSDFPKLMKSTFSDTIVLMTSYGTGTVVMCEKGFHGIGHYSNIWDMSVFEDYDGSVVLQNA